jgi:uncharacterized protein (DUF433 family)
MTTALDGHISVDEKGVARIAATRMKVVHLVKDQMAHGSSPEELRQAFPSLTLSQIYAALTYYHDHKSLLDAQIEQSSREADALHVHAGQQPSREELLDRMRRQAEGESGQA